MDILQDALDNNYVEQYKKQLTSPVKIEFGTLCYMIASGMLYILDRSDRDRIHFLHDIRNEVCAPGRNSFVHRKLSGLLPKVW